MHKCRSLDNVVVVAAAFAVLALCPSSRLNEPPTTPPADLPVGGVRLYGQWPLTYVVLPTQASQAERAEVLSRSRGIQRQGPQGVGVA